MPGDSMKESIVRIRIHPHLLKRFKLICIERDLSIPKVTSDLIRKFIESYEPTNRKI